MTELASLFGGVIIGVALVLLWVRNTSKPDWEKHSALAIYCALVRSGKPVCGATMMEAVIEAREFTRLGIEEMGKS